MVKRKSLGKGMGKGYKNLINSDPKVHSDSARGLKQTTGMNPVPKRMSKKVTNWKPDYVPLKNPKSCHLMSPFRIMKI